MKIGDLGFLFIKRLIQRIKLIRWLKVNPILLAILMI